MATMTRGELASCSGVNFETVRYYERRGLIPRPARSASNYRLYPEDSVRRLLFIKRAQELGFTLTEIGELLSLRSRPDAQRAEVRDRALVKIEDIDERIRSLQSIREALSRLTCECSGEGGITGCPILDAMEAGHR